MRLLWVLLLVLVSVSGGVLAQDDIVTVVTHDSFSLSEEVLQAFETETGLTVEILFSGDTGQMVNQSILSKNNPLGDVMYGIDNTYLSRALDEELFVSYETSEADNIPEEFLVDNAYVTPVDFGDVCLNYDVTYFEENELDLPSTLSDLVDPAYQGLLVVQNPATSSPGLAFLLATIAEFGETGDYTYLDYWKELVANDVLITDGWVDAYFGQFTAASETGRYPLVVSYASSPPFTVDEETETASTASIVDDGMCFRQVEYVGILAGTDNEEGAQLFVDFMVSLDVQNDLPFQMFVFPVHPDAELPELFADHAAIPENPVSMDASLTDENREEWIMEWVEAVLSE